MAKASADLWTIDLTAGMATCGHVQIGFDPAMANGLRLTFLRVGDIGLARQCFLAGEAIEAINNKLRRRW